MKKLLLIFFVLVIAWQANAQVGQLLGWQFSNPNFNDNFATVHTASSFWTHPGVESSTLSRGSGLSHSPAGYTRGYTSVGNNYVATTGSVRAADDYFQVTVQAKSGYVLSLSAIDLRLRRTGGGGNAYRWAYRLDDVSAFTDIGTADVSFNTADAEGVVQPIVDLRGITELQNLSSATKVTFRLYVWGYNTVGGTLVIGRYADGNITPSLAIRGDAVKSDLHTLLGWDLNIANVGGATLGSETSVAATTIHPNLSSSTLTKNGFGTASLARGLSTIGTVGTTKVTGEYFEFDLSPTTANKYVSLSALDIRIRRTGGGANTYSWSYNIDGGSFVDIGTPVTFLVSDDGIVQPTIDLSSITALKNLTNQNIVKFRLHPWNYTTTTGTFAIGRAYAGQTQYSLEVKGQVTDSPLPVSLTTFTAKANKQGTVNLAWSTASEQNNSHFDITRSADGASFTKVGEVKGSGTSSTVNNYSYTDAKPAAGVNYYQLKQVDFDGTSTSSNIVSAKVGLNADDLKVSVAANKATINVAYKALASGTASFNVYNTSGVKVGSLTQTVNAGLNQIAIPVTLGNSVHVLNVSQAGASVSTKF